MKHILIILAAVLILHSPLFIQNSHAADAPVPKTGQTTSYVAGDDGSKQAGVAIPIPRFTDNNTGTITDTLTGLIWLKNANCFNTQTWANALTSANSLASGACGLTDGSTAGQWRLPTIKELESLVDLQNSNPSLPTGHPFSAVQAYVYWSSSTFASSSTVAWYVGMNGGYVGSSNRGSSIYVWPVRSGQ